MTDITVYTIAIVALLSLAAIAYLLVKRYEITIFLIILSPWISAIFASDATMSAEEGTNIASYIRVGLLLLIGGVGIFEFVKMKLTRYEKLPRHFILFALFVLMVVISTSYSIDKRYTLIRSVNFVSLFGFLLGLNSWVIDRNRLKTVLFVMYTAVCFCLIVNLISIAILPEIVWYLKDEIRFQGLAAHPNTMGGFCMVSYPILLWAYSRSRYNRKWMVIFLIIICLSFHLLTGSRTSFFASVIGVATWLVVKGRKGTLLAAVGITCVFALILICLKPSLPRFTREEVSSVGTFTGRTEIWDAALTLALEKPIFGYGYGVSGKIFEDPRFYMDGYALWSGNARSSLHSGYLSVVIGLGLVGLSVFCILLFIPLWLAIRQHSDEYKAFVIALMLMCLITNFFESSIVEGSNIVSPFFWITWVIAGRMFCSDIVLSHDDVCGLDQSKIETFARNLNRSLT